MKLSRLILATGLILIASMIVVLPAFRASAQGGPTETPVPTVGTVSTESGAPTATPASEGPQINPQGEKAFRAARAVLEKTINRKLTYVTSYTWELAVFHDSAMGCPAAGETVTKGDVVGFIVTITTLGDKKTYELHVTFDLTKIELCPNVGGGTGGGSAVVSGQAVGGGFEAGGQIQDFNSGTVGHMRAAKLKWVKRQLIMPDGSGPAIVSAAHGQNFKALLSVKGDPGQVLNPGYWDQFAAYVGGLAASGADAIEIWNEENLDREWPNGQINPATYTQLLSKAFAAIKAANGNTIVILGAPSPTGAAGAGGKTAAYWNDDTYYQGLAAAGAGNYADCIGIHYNEGVVSPTQTTGDPRDSYPTRYFSTMMSRALGPFPGKSGCFTELGYLTPEGYSQALPSNFAWAQNTTVAQQAQWLSQAAVLSAQSGRIRLMIIFNVDFSVFLPTDPQAGYAMIRPGGGCPACDALAQVLP